MGEEGTSKSSAEIVDELLKELQDKNLCGSDDNREDGEVQNSGVGSITVEEKVSSSYVAKPKHRKHKKKELDGSKHRKHKKKQRHKRRKKRENDSDSSPSETKHARHKSSSKKDDKSSSREDDSFEIEWESDHNSDLIKERPAEINTSKIIFTNCDVSAPTVARTKTCVTDEKIVVGEIKRDKSDVSPISQEAQNSEIVDNKSGDLESVTSTVMKEKNADGTIEISILTNQSKNEEMECNSPVVLIENKELPESGGNSCVLSTDATNRETSVGVDKGLQENSNSDSVQEQSNKISETVQSVFEDSLEVTIKTSVKRSSRSKKRIKIKSLKTSSVLQDITKTTTEKYDPNEDSAMSATNSETLKKNTICSVEDTDGELDDILTVKPKILDSPRRRKEKKLKRKRNNSSRPSEKVLKNDRSRSPSPPLKSKRKKRSNSRSPPARHYYHRSRSRSPTRAKKERKSKRSERSRRSLSRSPLKRRSNSRSRSRDRHRKRSRSPRRSGIPDLREKIDKAKLLEIARKNAMAMINQGKLQVGVPLNTVKKQQLVTVKSGGKSVAELTDFCKQLVKKDGETSSSDDDAKRPTSEDEGEGPFIQHPFKLRESQPNIVMNIRNAVQIPVKTPAEKVAESAKLRIQFPVSSGSQHRKKESEWVPVSPQKEVVHHNTTVNTVALPSPTEKVFTESQPKPQSIDIGSIVSQRLRAVRKLQENPGDVEALSLIYQAQQQMQSWAESKQLPGQFTGCTDARLLTPEELAGPAHTQAWVKKVKLFSVLKIPFRPYQ